MARGTSITPASREASPPGVRDHVIAAVTLAVGWALMLAYAWPGIMTIDCFDQLREGRAGFYTDGHPPIVGVMWRYLDKLVSGPAGMYVVQTLALVAGLFFTLRVVLAPRRAAIAAVLVALYPPILAPMGVVWKDALMASCLVLGFAALSAPRQRRRVKVAAVVALWFASAIRYNAAAATMPLIVLLFEWRPAPGRGWRRWLERYGVATAVWIAITASSMLVNRALTDRPMHFWTSSFAVHDIAGTLAHVDETIPDAELRAVFAGSDLFVDTDIHAAFRARYRPTDYTQLVIGDTRLWDLPIMGQTPAPSARRAAIDRAWGEIVSGHLGAYLAHRLEVFTAILGIAKKNPGVMVQVGRGQNRLYAIPMNIEHRPYYYQDYVQRRVERIANKTPLFRAWLYFALALVFLVLARRQRDVLALLASGIVLECSMFVFSASPDYRYSHWLVITTVLGGIVIFIRRYRAARQPP